MKELYMNSLKRNRVTTSLEYVYVHQVHRAPCSGSRCHEIYRVTTRKLYRGLIIKNIGILIL